MPTLYYIHDPMCSWCWAFRSSWREVQSKLPANITVEYVLGGLAKDSDQPMPVEMQASIRHIWETIQQQVSGTSFNFDFWDTCTPRRSTYPSCRAVIAAKRQRPSAEQAMIVAIQKAYYLSAKNPSDESVLVKLADKLSLDTDLFLEALNSPQIQKKLLDNIHLAKSLGAQGFPSLILENDNHRTLINIDYNNPQNILKSITAIVC